jgi:hypothetical protein
MLWHKCQIHSLFNAIILELLPSLCRCPRPPFCLQLRVDLHYGCEDLHKVVVFCLLVLQKAGMCLSYIDILSW